MAELFSNYWLIILNNIECSHLNFKLQLYKTDVTPDTDSIDRTDGNVFTTKGDIDINELKTHIYLELNLIINFSKKVYGQDTRNVRTAA